MNLEQRLVKANLIMSMLISEMVSRNPDDLKGIQTLSEVRIALSDAIAYVTAHNVSDAIQQMLKEGDENVD